MTKERSIFASNSVTQLFVCVAVKRSTRLLACWACFSYRCRCKHFTEEHDVLAPFPCRSCKDCKEFKSSFTGKLNIHNKTQPDNRVYLHWRDLQRATNQHHSFPTAIAILNRNDHFSQIIVNTQLTLITRWSRRAKNGKQEVILLVQ